MLATSYSLTIQEPSYDNEDGILDEGFQIEAFCKKRGQTIYMHWKWGLMK